MFIVTWLPLMWKSFAYRLTNEKVIHEYNVYTTTTTTTTTTTAAANNNDT